MTGEMRCVPFTLVLANGLRLTFSRRHDDLLPLIERKEIRYIFLTWFIFLMIAAFCSPVPVPDNGEVQGYRYELGATLRISCSVGFNLVPSSSSFRTCISDGQGGGEWSGQDPVCECKSLIHCWIEDYVRFWRIAIGICCPTVLALLPSACCEYVQKYFGTCTFNPRLAGLDI